LVAEENLNLFSISTAKLNKPKNNKILNNMAQGKKHKIFDSFGSRS